MLDSTSSCTLFSYTCSHGLLTIGILFLQISPSTTMIIIIIVIIGVIIFASDVVGGPSWDQVITNLQHSLHYSC